jgi:hypothetical protein
MLGVESDASVHDGSCSRYRYLKIDVVGTLLDSLRPHGTDMRNVRVICIIVMDKSERGRFLGGYRSVNSTILLEMSSDKPTT